MNALTPYAELDVMTNFSFLEGGSHPGELVEQAKGQASAEGARLVASAQTQIELEATRARESLRKDVAGLAVRAAAKVLEREIDATTHAELLNKLATQI